MPGEVTGASLATFVLVNSECSLTTPRLPGASDVLAFAAITGTLTDVFFAADFHGIQFLYHAAATAVTTSAVGSSARRNTPPRNPGVKFPVARSRPWALGMCIVKSTAGVGSCDSSP